MDELFKDDLKQKAGGVLVSDVINNERFILLGKSNVPNRLGTWEGFGGKYEKQDISSLHTAIREMVEEFFNHKISTELVNQIASGLRNNKIIIKTHELFGMSYLIDFNGLNFIFQFLLSEIPSLVKYNTNNFFNYQTYINERLVTGEATNGLNEIQKIELIKLSDIKSKKINLRWFTNKIIWLMLISKPKH